jgi:RNA polymerase sigma-70 factor (ECF subfamily)
MVSPAASNLVSVSDSGADDYAGEMAAHQGRLQSFIRAMTGDAEAARDILQDTNVILLRKAPDFRPGTNFTAWAFRIARFEIMTWRRKAGRNRLVFDDDALVLIADTAERQDDLYLSRVEALRECLAKLPERQREAIRLRYLEGWEVADLAREMGESANTVSQLLFRARQNLLLHMEKSLAASECPPLSETA